jgi:hypothetical protein
MTAPLIFEATANRLGIIPDEIYQNCDRLIRFDYRTTRPRNVFAPPRVGQKSVIKRKRKK